MCEIGSSISAMHGISGIRARRWTMRRLGLRGLKGREWSERLGGEMVRW